MIVDRPEGNKLFGFYRGKVVRHLTAGKLKVYIPGVYVSDVPDQLPECEQATPLFAGTNKGNGCFSYPNLGTIVWCFFQNGDQNLPVCFGATLGGENAEEQYGEARCESSESSVESGDDARVHKVSVDQTTIKLWESGHIEILTKANKSVPADVYTQIDVSGLGTLNVKSTTQVHIESPDVMIDTDSFCVNTQTLKLNVGQQTQLTTDTLRVDVGHEIDVSAPTMNDMHTETRNIIAPVINLDATTGTGKIGLKSKTRTQFYS